MSRIDELIAEHCPEGVQFREIDSVIKLNFGSRITKLADAGSVYPVYGGGGESFRTEDFIREDEYVVSRFAMSAKCVRKVRGKFWMLDSGFTFSPRDVTATARPRRPHHRLRWPKSRPGNNDRALNPRGMLQART